MVLSRAAVPFILTLDNALYAKYGAGRLDLLLPTGCPAKAASAANPLPEALLDAPFQIQSPSQKTRFMQKIGGECRPPVCTSGVSLLLPRF